MLKFLKSLFKPTAYESIKAAAFLNKIKASPNAIVLDVRTPAEVAVGKLKNAVNIDFNKSDFEVKIGKLDKQKPYFVYCRSGVRSVKACRKMHEMGFGNLVNLAGGYMSI